MSIILKPGRPIRVNAARLTPLRTILEFVDSRRDWIEDNLAKFDEQASVLPPRALTEGSRYPLLGQTLTLKAVPTPLDAVFVTSDGENLNVHLPRLLFHQRGKDLSFARQALRAFYKDLGERYLRAKTAEYAQATGLRPAKIHIKETKTRWGSCSANRNLQLNWRLVVYRPAVIDAVIVHELVHLEHMNHSKKFWARLEGLVPQARALSREIRDQHRLGDFLDQE